MYGDFLTVLWGGEGGGEGGGGGVPFFITTHKITIHFSVQVILTVFSGFSPGLSFNGPFTIENKFL